MTASNRGSRNRSSFRGERKRSSLNHDSGNKKLFDDSIMPADDVGNRVEGDLIQNFTHDGIGNSLEENPAHLNSGVLSELLESGARSTYKRRGHEGKNTAPKRVNRRGANTGSHQRPKTLPPGIDIIDKHSPDDYIDDLKSEFAKLLAINKGMPFSFSMKSKINYEIDSYEEVEKLGDIKSLIESILSANLVNAKVEFSRYQTSEHRIAVFFVDPDEKDPQRKKQLILALRQVVSGSATLALAEGTNIFLVLSNAQSVIEDHLEKLGASKEGQE